MDKKAYLELAKMFDETNKKQFCTLVDCGMHITNLSCEEVAVKLITAPGTVSRWRNGRTAPTIFSRRPIINFFVEEMSKE